MSDITISIIVPFYNRFDLLELTIQSVLEQTYAKWELILVDDGSVGDITQLLNQFNDKRIVYLKRDRGPKGAATCRNIGFENARSDLILFLDSDDLLAPWALENRLDFISKNPDFALYVFEGLEFDNNDEKHHRLRTLQKEKNPLKEFLNFQSVWQTSCAVWKRETLHRTGLWDEEAMAWQDGEIHIRFLLTKQKFIWAGSIPDVFIRKHNDIQRISNIKSAQKYINLLTTYNKILSKLTDKSGLYSIFQRNVEAAMFDFLENMPPYIMSDYQNWYSSNISDKGLKRKLNLYGGLYKAFNHGRIQSRALYQIRKIGLFNKRKPFWSKRPQLVKSQALELDGKTGNNMLITKEVCFLQQIRK
ncbi:MAG: glycosyltransferase family 2 protein [bacterium]